MKKTCEITGASAAKRYRRRKKEKEKTIVICIPIVALLFKHISSLIYFGTLISSVL